MQEDVGGGLSSGEPEAAAGLSTKGAKAEGGEAGWQVESVRVRLGWMDGWRPRG